MQVTYSDAAEARQDCIDLTSVMIEKHRIHKTDSQVVRLWVTA